MRLKATSSPWFPRLREAERGAARGLRLLDPARCARLDDVRDQQVRIEGAGIEQVVGLGVLGERLAGGIRVLHAIFVVPVDRTLFDRDHEDPGVAMPAGAATWADHDVLEIEVRG